MDLRELLEQMNTLNASDLHLTVGCQPALRVNGRIRFAGGDDLTPESCEALVRQLAREELLARFHEQQQLSYSISFGELGFFRVNIYQQLGNLEASVRRTVERAQKLEELGIPPVMADLVRRDSGLILITGPTGNGKTTSFNALLNVINTEFRKKIVTIEDPVEFRHEHKRGIVVQLEVGTDTPSFGKALKHILRHDPDVIGVGELRDLESISTAVTAAETGHLVLATLHTPSAVGTISRMVDVFPPHQQNQVRLQLSAHLLGVMSQRLLPRVDGTGRVLASEIMVANDAIRNQIREGKMHLLASSLSTGRRDGMQLLDQSIRDYLMRGVISRETATNAVQDRKAIADLVGR